jgi:PAS domain-containing protein
MSSSPALPAEQLVTASDLVRHFGLWQERAARGPLYILHRGRPRFVLTSIETMNALCAPHWESDGRDHAPVDATALLDSVADLVLIADRDGAIIASSRAARAHFGALATAGAPVDAIASANMRQFLINTIRRVIASGVGDRLEIDSARREGRTLALTIAPAGDGVAIFAQDDTVVRAHQQAIDLAQALEEAMLAAGGIAAARIDARGYLVEPAPALAAMTGLTRETLVTLRLVALADLATRATLGAALEAALGGAEPAQVRGHLLINGADPIAVRIALAPVENGASPRDAVAVIVTA